jgi:LysM repeat protein
MRMNRITALACPCVLLIVAATFSTAQEPTPVPTPATELGSLKEAVEQQSKKIEALTQQVTELNRRMAGQKEPPAPPSPPLVTPPAAAPAPPQPLPPPAPAPAERAPAAPAPEAKTEPAAAEGGLKHTVAKGETLTSIAKRYNIPLGELEKFNKITDDRKLQIGHVLNIPTTANKAPEPPTEKKENP